jgi:hypothetical protein
MKPADAVPAGRIKVPPEIIANYCRRHHIRKLSLFGSVLRDDFRPEAERRSKKSSQAPLTLS